MTLSIVVPVYRPDPSHLVEAIDSVRAQTDPDWQLVLAADGPQPAEVDAVLDALDDPRIVLERCPTQGGISAATNAAIARATGEFVAFLDNDDVLSPRATQAIARATGLADDVDFVYSDEDKLDPGGRRVEPFHKPGWSPERLLGQMYTCHLSAYRKSLIDQVGGLRSEFNGAQDHDLALRISRLARRVVHIPEVLYHWRQSATSTALDPGSKQWAHDAGTRAVQAHLDDAGLPALAVSDAAYPGVTVINPALRAHPLVSIIVLTRGTARMIRNESVVLDEHGVRTVLQRSSYPNYEIVVVLDRDAPPALAAQLEALDPKRIRTVHNTEPFNFADANNFGVDQAEGTHLIFLNDDTEVKTPGWIERLVFWSSIPDVGVAGCCLEFADGRIQHAGIVSRASGPSHRWAGFAADHPGMFSSLRLTVNMLATTGACLAILRTRFEEVGGFTKLFPLNFNDVDLGLKLVSRGYRNVVDNRTRLYHFETSTRPKTVEANEVHLLFERWNGLINDDPWDNPNVRGVGVEETPAPPLLTRLREMHGTHYPPRAWPPLSC
ncbi:MAG: glycosyltransferase [Actinomycetota bacterium]|nr:glycosyltransferase [Actinomycetota bacterium]